MKFLDAEFVQGFIRMANDGWEQGWHERNGGNLSYRVKPEEVEMVKENFNSKEWQPIGTSVPYLAGEYFLVTGSGKYFRNVILKPEDSICMIELDEKGENYRIVWGLVNGGRPTSELPSHLMNLEVKKKKNPNYRVVRMNALIAAWGTAVNGSKAGSNRFGVLTTARKAALPAEGLRQRVVYAVCEALSLISHRSLTSSGTEAYSARQTISPSHQERASCG